MKKFLAFALILASVGVTHAASLSWSAFSINQPGTTTTATGYTIYLFITEQSGDFGSAATTVSAVTDIIKSGVEFYTEGGKNYLKNGADKVQIAAVGETDGGRIKTAATGYNGNNFGGGDSLKAFAVIFDASSLSSASNYIVTGVKSASWTSTSGAKTLAFGSQANATWTAVPEPSTAVLALAGLALLLKRRKA